MKKFGIYIIVIFFIIIVFPSIATIGKKKENLGQENLEEISNEQKETTENENYDYLKFGTIKLYHSKTSTIEEMPIDEYLYGVVSSEMPASYEMEALKAQAIVARTYTIYQISNSSRKT